MGIYDFSHNNDFDSVGDDVADIDVDIVVVIMMMMRRILSAYL